MRSAAQKFSPRSGCRLELITQRRVWLAASCLVSRHVLMEPTLRWIVFVFWLPLTLIWISYSSSAGSGPRVAVIPPALVLMALVFTWLLKRFVVRIAGGSEPLYFHLLGLRTPIEGSSSYCIGRSRSGYLRRRSCEINFRSSGF